MVASKTSRSNGRVSTQRLGSISCCSTSTFVFIENTSGVFDNGWVDLVFVTRAPTLLAGAVGWWIGRRVGTWYAVEASASH